LGAEATVAVRAVDNARGSIVTRGWRAGQVDRLAAGTCESRRTDASANKQPTARSQKR